MDFSKAFDCLNHELLIAKLEACGFSRFALKLVYDSLLNRKQRVKINGSFSSWQELIKGVPQGSVLGFSYSMYSQMTFSFRWKRL